MFPPSSTAEAKFDQPLLELVRAYPGIVGASYWDEETQTKTLEFYTGADSSEEASFLAKANQVIPPKGLKFVLKPIDWNYAARVQLMLDITGHTESWKSFFGSVPEGAYLDEGGTVHVSLASPDLAPHTPLPDGTPYVADGPSTAEFQVGRATDVSPQDPGDALQKN